MRLVALFALALVPVHARAQWDIQQSHTTASLLSVHAVTEMVAWASGAKGTVLRTIDGGVNWQSCAIPKGAEKVDLVSVQGSDENTAVAMSTGKGSLSSVYKTTDGCQTWRLVFANPDANGSFTSIRRMTNKQLYLLGSPVDGKFSMFYSADAGETWNGTDDPGLESEKGDLMSAGNGNFISVGPFLFFGARGPSALHLYHTYPKCEPGAPSAAGCPVAWAITDLPFALGETGNVEFSLAARTQLNMGNGSLQSVLVAVGSSAGSAATSKDDGKSWKAAAVPPSAGVRAVAYSASTRSWIAVGPDQTEVSTDDGQTWRLAGAKNAGQSWGALSLPFIVGNGGSIGRLDPRVFKH